MRAHHQRRLGQGNPARPWRTRSHKRCGNIWYIHGAVSSPARTTHGGPIPPSATGPRRRRRGGVVSQDARKPGAPAPRTEGDGLKGRRGKGPGRDPPGPSMLVGLTGFEPVTSRLSGVRSNRLSYRPSQEKIISPSATAHKKRRRRDGRRRRGLRWGFIHNFDNMLWKCHLLHTIY